MTGTPARPSQSHWPEEARIAAIAALSLHGVSASDTWLLVSDILDAVAPLIRAGDRKMLAARLSELAAAYPEDVFPPGAETRDAISGTAMRHAYRNAAREAEEGPPS